MKALLIGSVCSSYVLVGFILSLPYGFLTGAQSIGEFVAMILLLPLAALAGLILLIMSYQKIGDVIMSPFIKRHYQSHVDNLLTDKATLSYVRTVFWVYTTWICLPMICNIFSIITARLDLTQVSEFIFVSRYSSLFIGMIAILVVAIAWNLIGEMIRAIKSKALQSCQ